MTLGAVITAITRNSPPQGGQRFKSMANTRLRRAIQPSGATTIWDAHSSFAVTFTSLGRATMSARRRALGADTPW